MRPWNELKHDPEYLAYAKRCVDACCELMGEDTRQFWETQCSFDEDFNNGTEPEEVASQQQESL